VRFSPFRSLLQAASVMAQLLWALSLSPRCQAQDAQVVERDRSFTGMRTDRDAGKDTASIGLDVERVALPFDAIRPQDPVPLAETLRELKKGFFEVRILYDSCPCYVSRPLYSPSIDLTPPKDCPQAAGIKNLVRRELFRELRSKMKSQWRSQFSDTPSMRYESYEERLFLINEVGRDANADDVGEDFYSSKQRESVFRRSREGEEEIAVVKLGPLMVLDSGSLSIDTSVVKRFTGQDEPAKAVEVGPLDEKRRPLMKGNGYKVHSRFRLGCNPLKGLSGNPMDAFTSYGASVDVSWLSDILRKERFSTEIEGQLDQNGYCAFYFNLVLKSW
jgi:hypothetical protein